MTRMTLLNSIEQKKVRCNNQVFIMKGLYIRERMVENEVNPRQKITGIEMLISDENRNAEL